MRIKTLVGGAMVAFGLAAAGIASATTIDFSTYALGTPITTVGDATFSLIGGDGPGGTPVTGSFGTPSLGNSPTGDYPTSEILEVSFAVPVTNVSFTFDNFGDNSPDPSTVTAYDASGNVLGSVNVSTGAYSNSFALGSINASGIATLDFNNGSGGNYDWEFGVGELTYNAVPEPAAWALMLLGIGGLGAAARSRRKALAA